MSKYDDLVTRLTEIFQIDRQALLLSKVCNKS